MEFYVEFKYIIVNNNGDVIVLDYGCSVVVVVNVKRKFCFIYIGYFFGLGLILYGICINEML